MARFYINEENLGTEATAAQARQTVEILQAQGWDVAYGDSLVNDRSISDEEQADFDSDFYKALDQIKGD